MKNSKLCILIENKDLNTDLLAGFPYKDGQYEDGQEDNEVADTDQTWIIINLGDRKDTTVLQEQFLNTKPQVIEYTIR